MNTVTKPVLNCLFTEAARYSAVHFSQWEETMLGWSLTFLILALLAAVLGFGGMAAAFAGVAKILFVLFLILFLVSLVARTARGV